MHAIMKKALIFLILALALILSGCSLLGLPGDISFDNDDIIPVDGMEGYYIDSDLAFCAEIRGSYKSDRPFTLDDEDESLRVWDNLYLYEYDYFQLIAANQAEIFYSVKEEDLEYVTLNDNSANAQINDGKSGIYKVIFDLEEKVFDLEYKGEILEPVYERMEGCDVFSLASEFTPLVPNPDNSDELMIKNYTVEAGAVLSFHEHGDYHLSSYKVVLDHAANGKWASGLEDGDKHISFLVGGIYNLYINPTTYLLRVELTNPEDADYSLMVYESDEFKSIAPVSEDQPHLFVYRYTAKRLGDIPYFVSSNYSQYKFNVLPSDLLDSYEDSFYFLEAGNYEITINMLTFELSCVEIPE